MIHIIRVDIDSLYLYIFSLSTINTLNEQKAYCHLPTYKQTYVRTDSRTKWTIVSDTESIEVK